jgi:hypothetical protein
MTQLGIEMDHLEGMQRHDAPAPGVTAPHQTVPCDEHGTLAIPKPQWWRAEDFVQ